MTSAPFPMRPKGPARTESPDGAPPRRPVGPELWGGLECSVVRVGAGLRD